MKIDDRLTEPRGRFFFSGMSMLVRLPLEQARRDREHGLATGTLITGYPGSPLAGYDLQLSRIGPLLDEQHVKFLPAGNEEQAATALMGTQMLDDHPHSDYVGVTGFWYGKGPGVDRAGDAFKHGNFAGTSRNGAVVVLSGEDHEAKSSTMPFQQDFAFVSAGIPILYPSSVAEFRTLGLHAVAMSRYAGCWVALKLTSALCDGGETVDVDTNDVQIVLPSLRFGDRPFVKRTDFSFFPGKNIEHERHLYRERHLAALAYARANGLNRIEGKQPGDRVGIITAGKSAVDVRQALLDLGLDPTRLEGTGLALLTLGLVYPVDEELIREFGTGLTDVIVIEEKRGVIEPGVRAALQTLGQPIRVVGKSDELGNSLFPIEGAMDADYVASVLSDRLSDLLPMAATVRADELASVAARDYTAFAPRTPNFCSGCPHSTSTVLAPGQIAFGAPGCNCFNEVIEQTERHIDTMTQFGGEGLPWIGLAPFTDRTHLIQHVGDGSMYHSSYLNVRWAVATKTRITFKLLWNGVVANTGAQAAPGEHGLAALTRGLESEGVARIVICSKDPGQYRRQRLGAGVQLRRDDEIVRVSGELEEIDGVTVLIYDESCANERRRRIKRGLIAAPTEHVLINERVCENCGDCGTKSNCMSLQKTPTEFGPKTQVHGSSCNQDQSCLQGDCPSFATVTVRAGTGYRTLNPPDLDTTELAIPRRREIQNDPFHIYMPGVGGTGVLTLNAILGFAASLEGLRVISYDQTGAAQKWGPVLSSLVLLPEHSAIWPALGSADRLESAGHPAGFANKVGRARADLYLALDEVAAVTPINLDRCSVQRTTAVINSDIFPTGEMVRDVWQTRDGSAMASSIRSYTSPEGVLEVPARTIAEKLFGDYMLTNIVALGAAVQQGLLPISSSSIEAAIVLNGVAVTQNTLAFRYGRLWSQDPARVAALVYPTVRGAILEREYQRSLLTSRQQRAHSTLGARIDAADLPEETRRLLEVRVGELLRYQSAAWAGQYLDSVLSVAAQVHQSAIAGDKIVDAVAANLYKLMSYKDEYEVARLFLDEQWRRSIADTFDAPLKVHYNLHPPAARLIGRDSKIRLGPWFEPAFRVLRAGRRLRGTPFDPFGRQAGRREERELITWYQELLSGALAMLNSSNAQTVLEIAELPDLIRGYEQVKSDNASRARVRAEDLREQLRRPRLPLLR
jgi:indolepyruvate ferredoxin oxidoreductase